MSKQTLRIDGKLLPISKNIKEITIPEGRWVEFEHSIDEHWYGHGFSHIRPYQLEKGTIINENFAVNNIQSSVWISSAGFIIFAPTTSPLSVRINENGNRTRRLCCKEAELQLKIIYGKNLHDTVKFLLKN